MVVTPWTGQAADGCFGKERQLKEPCVAQALLKLDTDGMDRLQIEIQSMV